jgi:hypothetical protein
METAGNYLKKRRWALGLSIFFIFLALILGSYHVSHGGGWRSGSAEITLAIVMAIVVWHLYRNRTASIPVPLALPWCIATIVVYGGTIVLLLILSPYHFTHDGLRSGIIELVLAIDLLVSAWLFR